MAMSGTHAEAMLNKITKPELVQPHLKTEATLGLQITDLSKEIKDTLTYLKKLEVDTVVVKTANDRIVERVVKTERLCWEEAQYSRPDNLEIFGIPNSVVFKKIGVEIDKWDVQACHRLKEKERTMVKFVNRKDCLQILRVKKNPLNPIN